MDPCVASVSAADDAMYDSLARSWLFSEWTICGVTWGENMPSGYWRVNGISNQPGQMAEGAD